LKIG